VARFIAKVPNFLYEPVKYPLRWAASLHVPFSVQCHAAMRSSVLLR